LDYQVEGSHTDIGAKILEKFNIKPEIISAVKSHHEEYPYESIEAKIIQIADQVSGARPGARKDTLENYLKRLGDLEDIALALRELIELMQYREERLEYLLKLKK
jgi:ribonuclease Y